mmetsp:Transcript_11846/g.33993  ORF Transcript_11846/g.33993 Transcript_11846/m.33993 type:complete len:236 (+) Transcript_11846:1315-2022(+)
MSESCARPTMASSRFRAYGSPISSSSKLRSVIFHSSHFSGRTSTGSPERTYSRDPRVRRFLSRSFRHSTRKLARRGVQRSSWYEFPSSTYTGYTFFGSCSRHATSAGLSESRSPFRNQCIALTTLALLMVDGFVVDESEADDTNSSASTQYRRIDRGRVDPLRKNTRNIQSSTAVFVLGGVCVNSMLLTRRAENAAMRWRVAFDCIPSIRTNSMCPTMSFLLSVFLDLSPSIDHR